MSATPPMPWWVALLVSAGISTVGTLYMHYVQTDRTDVQRLSIVEQKVDDVAYRLHRIEDKIDQITWNQGK